MLALERARLKLCPGVTFLVGENGSGKSTLIEAIAVAAGLNAEGGGGAIRFTTRPSDASLHRELGLDPARPRPLSAFFLRAESFFNVATEVERQGGMEDVYDAPLHAHVARRVLPVARDEPLRPAWPLPPRRLTRLVRLPA